MALDPTGLLVGGGLLAGSQLLGNKSDAGEPFSKEALAAFANLKAPTAEELQYQLQQLQLQGIITPQQATAINQDPSILQNINGSPEAQGAQMEALSRLQGIGEEGGMTTADKANLADIQGQNSAAERGSREALAMNAKERGVSGSGIDLVSQMINQQDSAGRANTAGLDVAKMAQQRALDAIQQSGQLGTQIQGQQFGEEAQKATAQDAINRFNTANRQDVVNRNVTANNAAQAQNLAEKQRISDTNITNANTKAQADAAAKQKAYEDQVQIAAGKSGQLTNLATGARENAAGNQAFQGKMIGTAGAVLASPAAAAPKKYDEYGNEVQ